MAKTYAGLNLTNSATKLGEQVTRAEAACARSYSGEHSFQPRASSKDLTCVLCNQKGRRVRY